MTQTARRRDPSPRLSPPRDLITTVTGSGFAQLVLEARGPVVVEFMSYGCGHCRVLEPILQQVAEALESTQQFFRVNLAVEPELAAQYQVQSIPTLLYFSGGVARDRAVGAAGKKAIVSRLEGLAVKA